MVAFSTCAFSTVSQVISNFPVLNEVDFGPFTPWEQAPLVGDGCWDYPDFNDNDTRHDLACCKFHTHRNYGCPGVHYVHY